MSSYVKIALYVVLAGFAIFFGVKFRAAKHSAEAKSAPREETPAEPLPAVTLPPGANTGTPAATNSLTNATIAATKPMAVITNAATNATSAVTNVIANTNQVVMTNPVAASPRESAPAKPAVMTAAGELGPGKGYGKVMSYLGALIVSLIFLGLLIARDVTEYIGSSTLEFLFNDDGKGIYDPEYDLAEREWGKGNRIEAIQMMRDYYKKHPREVYVGLRIAEIYEKDFQNYLAAALEYEEVLKHKLPDERWGWAAVHLCNLYSKLGKTNPTIALLRRIVTEYGETKAADKARKRLAMYDGGGDVAPEELPEVEQAATPPPALPDLNAPPVNPAGSSLPPGFRPKK